MIPVSAVNHAVNQANVCAEAGIGLVAYPFQGISKSLEAAFRSNNRKVVFDARMKSGYYESSLMQISEEDKWGILRSFDEFWSSNQ